MWGTILSLVLGAVPGIVRELAKARVDLANAQTEMEKVHAQERIKALEAQRDVLIAESSSPWNTVGRMVWLVPAGIYFSWTMVWDKIACKWFNSAATVDQVCTTDKLGDWQMGILLTIVGFYFVTDLTKILKR